MDESSEDDDYIVSVADKDGCEHNFSDDGDSKGSEDDDHYDDDCYDDEESTYCVEQGNQCNHIIPEKTLTLLISRIRCDSCGATGFCTIRMGPPIGITSRYIKYACAKCNYVSEDLLHTHVDESTQQL